jgi:diguanylate cyclase (GGDEF)-like protein
LGDQVIVEVTRRLAASLRDEDTNARPHDEPAVKNAVLSRIGGDEFTILLEQASDPSGPMRVGQRILSSVAAPFIVEGRDVNTSASIGITVSTMAHIHADDLLRDADVAMRRAKALGGNRCEVFDEAMHSRAIHRLKLEDDLHAALRNQQFRVCYQPVIDLRTNQITAFEALLRWQHPEQGLISPLKFIDAAEDTGLLFSTGLWLISQACQEPISVSVNLSAKQFADPRLVPELQSILRQANIGASRLQLEISESAVAANTNLTASLLSRIKHLGVKTILDDFGTGNSSLVELRRLPFDALKIDRTLIGEMFADREAGEIVELIIIVVHKLKLKVIAEGIETTRHLEHLRQLGCDLGQGYFFTQPVDAEVAGKLLRDTTPPMRAKAIQA